MIKISTQPTTDQLFAQSKWWGQPDMPETMPYPELAVNDDGEMYDDPLTFVCQLRCDELAALDPENLLPHEGMLYFFAALDYFLGDIDALSYPGMGEWQPQYFRVLYSPTCNDLHTHSIVYDDGTAVGLPAEAIVFSQKDDDSTDANATALLGQPYLEEVREAMPGMISLLQIDEEDRWDLRFHDCGMLCFLISEDDLRARRFDRVRCYLHSF